MSNKKIIFSLFDATGNWSEPYRKAGYDVVQQDIQLGHDIFDHTVFWANQFRADGITIHGLMAAVPCTDFASSGARWWKDKVGQPAPYEGNNLWFEDRLDYFVSMVYCVLLIVEWLQPKWWVIENPVGRIQKLVPELGDPFWFQPWQYGDPYTKKTGLWGNFNKNLPQNPVLPLFGSMMHKMSSTRQDERSITPKGFAKSFFLANP